ncbi:MAG: hypothetical protein ACFFDB_00770 [Promethearchaeota archaeon]
MTLDILKKVKDGEEISLKYSFLSVKMNTILTKYINNKIKKRKLEKNIKSCKGNLEIAQNIKNKEEAKRLEEKLAILESKYENVRFMRLSDKERRTMADIRKKIRAKKEILQKERDEISEIQTLFDILNIKL